MTGSHQVCLLMISSFQLATGQSKYKKSTGIKVKRICRPLSNQPLHHNRSREGPAVLVGDRPIDIALKEGEHREPNASSSTLLVGPGVG